MNPVSSFIAVTSLSYYLLILHREILPFATTKYEIDRWVHKCIVIETQQKYAIQSVTIFLISANFDGNSETSYFDDITLYPSIKSEINGTQCIRNEPRKVCYLDAKIIIRYIWLYMYICTCILLQLEEQRTITQMGVVIPPDDKAYKVTAFHYKAKHRIEVHTIVNIVDRLI